MTLLFYVLKFIGFSYRSALDPENGILLSFVGFTCGVGFCEEAAKAIPLLWAYRKGKRLDWRGSVICGLASGVGFGVAEGVQYASDYYNGVSPFSTYVMRFVSCVALHAVWSGSVGITIFKYRRAVSKAINAIMYGDIKEQDFDWEEIVWPTVQVLGVAIVLHGLYDTLLTQQMILPALVVALVSFAWLGFQIESFREEDAQAPPVRRTARTAPA